MHLNKQGGPKMGPLSLTAYML